MKTRIDPLLSERSEGDRRQEQRHGVRGARRGRGPRPRQPLFLPSGGQQQCQVIDYTGLGQKNLIINFSEVKAQYINAAPSDIMYRS